MILTWMPAKRIHSGPWVPPNGSTHEPLVSTMPR